MQTARRVLALTPVPVQRAAVTAYQALTGAATRRALAVARTHIVIHCGVCQAETELFQMAYGKQWYRCPDCGFLQAELTKGLTTDLRRGEGFAAGEGEGGGGYREYWTARLLHDDLGLPNVLLFGTGNTPTLASLLSEGVETWGCDFSADVMADRQARHGQDRFFHPFNFPSRQFDVVIAVEVLEHLTTPMRTLRTLRTHLSTSGVIAGTTDIWDGTPIGDHIYLDSDFHLVYWSPSSLKAAAAQLGLEVALFELIRPGSVLPDEKFGILWPRKRVFFLYPPEHRGYFAALRERHPILPIDRP
ncbi:MAG: methyltransferase domain-containing protein [Chloroflexi bacterium]|nr:methyltransferase domain-containing protein [Chloroflexota bacterium]